MNLKINKLIFYTFVQVEKYKNPMSSIHSTNNFENTNNATQSRDEEIARLLAQIEILKQEKEKAEQEKQKIQLEHKKQQKQTKNQVQEFLKQKIAFFRPEHNPTIFDDLESSNLEMSNKLVAGLIQSGKSNVICGLALYLTRGLGLSVVVLLRNYNADYEQLRSKFEAEYDTIPFYAGDRTQLRHMFKGDPKVIICIENEKQMIRLDEEINRHNPPFVLIADEVDSVCYKADETGQRIMAFESIKSKSSQFIGVTATSYVMLYKEHLLTNRAIYRVPVDPCYKGIDYLIGTNSIEELPNNFDFKLGTVTPAVWELSEDMEKFYTRIANVPPFEEKEADGRATRQPVIVLQTTETEIKKQFQCMGALARHPVFKKEFSIIVYNGEGVYLYSPQRLDNEIIGDEGEPTEGIVPSDRYSHYISDCNVLHFKKAGIKHALQYFKNRAQTPSHIIIIAGLMVGRGLNIVSSDYQWHLTHQILRVSDNADISDLIQKLRLLGIFRDSLPLRLFLTKREATNLKKGHFLHNTLLNGAENHETLAVMPELVEEIGMPAGHIPRRRTTKKCMEPNWNEIVEEKKEDVVDGEYYCVLPEKLAPREKDIYTYTLEFLQDKKNKWIPRNQVVEFVAGFTENVQAVQAHLKNICYRSDRSNKTQTETCSGLLFKKEGNRWFLRLN
jgi:hypothetical protein